MMVKILPKIRRAEQPWVRREVIRGHVLYLGDSKKLVIPELLELKSIIALVTDPPYGLGTEFKKSRGMTPASTRSSGGNYGRDWGKIIGDNEVFDPRPFLNFKCCILWGANCYSSYLPNSPGWLVWDKKRGGTVSSKFRASSHELAWTNFLGHIKTFNHLWDGMRRESESREHYHPTQKPIRLMEWCLSILPTTITTIFDPFMGSGTTGVACSTVGKNFIGVELDPRYFETACERIYKAERNLGFFNGKEDGNNAPQP